MLVEDALEDDAAGAFGHAAVAEAGDEHFAGRVFPGVFFHLFVQCRQEVFLGGGQGPAEHQQAGVQEVDEVRQADAEVVAEAGGIGCMSDARQRAFYDAMVKSGIVPAGLDISRAYTTRFVCKGVGRDAP